MEEKNLVFFDQSNREWKVGKLNSDKIPKFPQKNIYIIELFCKAESMFPTQNVQPDDFIFCSCLKCFQGLSEGNICLTIELETEQWNIGLMCSNCTLLSTLSSKLPITHVFETIYPLILKGSDITCNYCLVCEKFKCKNKECKEGMKLLYANKIEELLEHFYLIQLNIYKPLLKERKTLKKQGIVAHSIWRNYLKCVLQK